LPVKVQIGKIVMQVPAAAQFLNIIVLGTPALGKGLQGCLGLLRAIGFLAGQEDFAKLISYLLLMVGFYVGQDVAFDENNRN